MRRQLIALVVGVCLPALGRAADPVTAIQRFSGLQPIDLPRLLNGDIQAERGDLMEFPNGISAQCCFAVPLPAEVVAKRSQRWDPSPHEALKVYAFHEVSVPPAPQDFQQLVFPMNQKPVRWLVDKTLATTATKSDLNLGRQEAETLAGFVQKRADAQIVAAGWAQLLTARAKAFQDHGVAGIQSYERPRENIAPAAQLRVMVREAAGVGLEFAPLLRKIGLAGTHADPALAPFHYWSLFDADHHAVLNLGAVYQLAVGDHYQLADVQYYVCAELYTGISLMEVWPVRVGDRDCSLVWRGDYIAAPTLAFTKGSERLAYGALMLQDIKKEIRCFLADLKSSH